MTKMKKKRLTITNVGDVEQLEIQIKRHSGRTLENSFTVQVKQTFPVWPTHLRTRYLQKKLIHEFTPRLVFKCF